VAEAALHLPNPIGEDIDPLRDGRARCAETPGLTHLFFSDDLADISAAQQMCASCPLMVRCLDGAIQRREPCGVWGGQLLEDGLVVRVKRPRGRPPKRVRANRMFVPLPVPDVLSRSVGFKHG
jgi:WhiB family redox-sensing transcriptional regulator